MSGWIKLHRSLLNWEWYDDKNATRLLVHLLVSVNYEDKKWKGIVINAGSMVLSWETLSKGIGLSSAQCRTAMTKLENSGEVTRHITNKYQLVTLVKWEEMQSNDNQIAGNLAGKSQADNKQIATTKEIKENKESKEERRERVKAEFKNSLLPFLDKYDKEMLKAFFDYWSEHGPNDAKMRFEKEKSYDISKRLATWAKRERAFNPSAEPQRKKNRLEI